MKKKLLYLFIGVFGFFFFSCYRVNAATNVSLDFDKYEHFNYYYEFMHNTKFYQFVVGKGDSFGDYLNSFDNDVKDVFFVFSSDINYNNKPDNSYYSIVLTKFASTLSYSSGNYSILASSTGTYAFDILFFDNDMNYINNVVNIHGSNFSNYININYSDFTYIMGSYYGRFVNGSISNVYGLKWSASGSTYDIRVTGVTINDIYYRISDIGTIDWFTNIFVYQLGGFVSSVFSSDYSKYDLDDLGLGFISKNYVIGSRGDDDERLAGIFICFSDSDSYNVSISVPDGFSSQSFNYDNRYYLIPNSLSCTDSQSLLYFSTSDVTTINFISYDVLQDTLSTNNIKMYQFKFSNRRKKKKNIY